MEPLNNNEPLDNELNKSFQSIPTPLKVEANIQTHPDALIRVEPLPDYAKRPRYPSPPPFLSEKAETTIFRVGPTNEDGRTIGEGERDPLPGDGETKEHLSASNGSQEVIRPPHWLVHFCSSLCLKSWFALVGLLIAFRAIIVRMGFICFTCVAIVTVVTIKSDNRYWLLCVTIIPLLVDLIMAIRNQIEHTNTGKAIAKWFSICNFAYLICACPPIWMIELHNMDVLNEEVIVVKNLDALLFTTTTTPAPTTTPSWLPTLQERVPENESLMIMGGNIEDYLASADFSRSRRIARSLQHFAVNVSSNTTLTFLQPRQLRELPLTQKIRLFQQLFLLSVIVGRWLMPREGLTRDQLSQLLLINIGTAADILELLEAFNEQEVRQNYFLRTVILCLWQASLLQFCFNKTAVKDTGMPRGRDSFASSRSMSVKQSDFEIAQIQQQQQQQRNISTRPATNRKESKTSQCYPGKNDSVSVNLDDIQPPPQSKCLLGNIFRFFCRERPCLCCETELWAIGMSLMLQDMPFLCLRLVLIFRFNVRSAANVFFTCKNTLLIMLQVFRSGVIISEAYSKSREARRMEQEEFEMYNRRYQV